MNKIQSGFSLIELLVVIAIIGILATVGTIGYGNYIEGTKKESLKSNSNSIQKLIETNITTDEIDNSSINCLSYLKDLIASQGNKKSVYKETDLAYINGNCSGSANINVINVGQILLACEDPTSTNTKEIYQCTCEPSTPPVNPEPQCTCALKPQVPC